MKSKERCKQAMVRVGGKGQEVVCWCNDLTSTRESTVQWVGRYGIWLVLVAEGRSRGWQLVLLLPPHCQNLTPPPTLLSQFSLVLVIGVLVRKEAITLLFLYKPFYYIYENEGGRSGMHYNICYSNQCVFVYTEVEADRIQDPTEALALLSLKKRVEEEVRTATENNIVLPPTLLDQVADHMLNLSKDEPCGLR